MKEQINLIRSSPYVSRTLEEVEQKYNDSLDHHIFTTIIMLKIHYDMIKEKHELIQQRHVHHEK